MMTHFLLTMRYLAMYIGCACYSGEQVNARYFDYSLLTSSPVFKGQVGSEKRRWMGRAPLLSLPPPLNPASASIAVVAVAETSDRTWDATAPFSVVVSSRRGCDTTWACPPPEQCPNQIRQMRCSCHWDRRGSEWVRERGRRGAGRGRVDRRRRMSWGWR